MTSVNSERTGTVSGDEQATGTGGSSQGLAGQILNRLKRLGGPIAGLIIMIIVLSFLSPFFLTVTNLTNIMAQIADIGIMAAGAFLVILVGGIDLSVAAVMALTMMFTAWLYK